MHARRPASIVLVIAVFGTSLFAGVAPAHAAGLEEELGPALQEVIDRARDDTPIVGLSASVVLADGDRWEGGSGLLELGSSEKPMLPGTSSVAASITKTFLAALTLQLVAEGRLELGDRLARWFPEYPFADKVKVRHLLRHTSGLKDYFQHPDYARLVFKRRTHHWTTAEILELVRNKLLFAPGNGWSYSNTNYLFLGLIVEQVTGRPLAVELRERFIDPLGLSGTFLQGDEVIPVEAAYGYLWDGSTFKGFADGTALRPHTSAATVAWAAGGLLSTAHDLATWTRALYGGAVLDAGSMARMLTFNSSDYGMGTRLFAVDGLPAWGHTGSLRGYMAVVMYLPDHQLTVAVMTNRGRISAVKIARQLARTVIAWLAEEPEPPTFAERAPARLAAVRRRRRGASPVAAGRLAYT